MFKVQKRTTLKGQAQNQIKEAIKSGWLKPGDRIVESKIAEDMGISRFPIREAISSLESEGLLVTIPYKGTFVNKLNQKELEELYSLRILLETYAMKLFMKNVTKDKITELESILHDMKRGIDNNKMDLITEDMRFHEKICELSGNGKLLEIWLALSRQIRIYLTVEQHSYESVEHLVDTHRVILDAIKSGNSRTAQAKLKKNINNGLSRLKIYIMK